MASSFCHPWENQEQEPSATHETESALKIKERGREN